MRKFNPKNICYYITNDDKRINIDLTNKKSCWITDMSTEIYDFISLSSMERRTVIDPIKHNIKSIYIPKIIKNIWINHNVDIINFDVINKNTIIRYV